MNSKYSILVDVSSNIVHLTKSPKLEHKCECFYHLWDAQNTENALISFDSLENFLDSD